MKLALQSEELIYQLSMHFVNKLSSQANEQCTKQDKRTITSEHVYLALQEYGFKSPIIGETFGLGIQITESELKAQIKDRFKKDKVEAKKIRPSISAEEHVELQK